MKKIIILLLLLAACSAQTSVATKEDSCMPFWDSPEANTNCVGKSTSGPTQDCYLDSGQMWEWYSDGTRIKYNGTPSAPGSGEQMCYVKDGMVIYRLSDDL